MGLNGRLSAQIHQFMRGRGRVREYWFFKLKHLKRWKIRNRRFGESVVKHLKARGQIIKLPAWKPSSSS